MGRRILYGIDNDGRSTIDENEWTEVLRLQHWYNSEFDWSTGRLAFKRYLLFPNTRDFEGLDIPMAELIQQRLEVLRREGSSELRAVARLEAEGLLTVKWGGILDSCLASGFTRVANNEWNAYLVCEFLLKCSRTLRHASITVRDEGGFVRCGTIWMEDGRVIVERRSTAEQLIATRRIFAVVDREQYARHEGLKNQIAGFRELNREEKSAILHDWNWLGYGESRSRDPEGGCDLNLKVRGFEFRSKER
ncbi:MAG: hypothetical protein FJ215_03270 [Ignavibacteria bacterium]|nr:hypothetical protein [Ignavibacteria bacterium]